MLHTENIKEWMRLFNNEQLKAMFAEIPITDLLTAWEDWNGEEQIKIFSLLTLEKKVALIQELSPVHQTDLIGSLSSENARVLLEELEPDDLADFIQAVSPQVRESVWKSLSDEAREETQLLLRFDEDDAAGIMTPRYIAITANRNVGDALAFIRKHGRDVELVYNIYVVDPLKRLCGVISLKDLLMTDDQEQVGNIMVKNVISVREDTDQEEVAKILETYDFIALPVVDPYNRLLGIVTFDDVMDVIREEETEDLYKMGAMSGGTEKYLDSSIWQLMKKRVPWLAVLLLTATFTANVLNTFQGLFIAATVLTLFIPLITGTGGNSGTQSSTLIIRGLATGELHFHDLGRVLLKEFFVGLALGICMGILVILRSFIFPPFIHLSEAVTVAIALASVVTVATLIGALAPLFINRLGLDPAVMAGPLMTTLIDLAGLTIYFLMAKWLLGL